MCWSILGNLTGRFKQGACLELKAILDTLGALGPSVQQTKGLISEQEERRENWFLKYREHILKMSKILTKRCKLTVQGI